jgi:hypothetical protein
MGPGGEEAFWIEAGQATTLGEPLNADLGETTCLTRSVLIACTVASIVAGTVAGAFLLRRAEENMVSALHFFVMSMQKPICFLLVCPAGP